MPENSFPDRPWDKGNNPKTAVREFLALHPEFTVDSMIDAKLMISVAPGGYLKRNTSLCKGHNGHGINANPGIQ